MGHDISGYKKADTNHSEKIAYLRRGAGNPLARVIYKALGAKECDCGCSGCGDEKTYTTEQLKAALSRLPSGEETENERIFLNDCIAAGEPVTVTFY
jgi:hypothetical protein